MAPVVPEIRQVTLKHIDEKLAVVDPVSHVGRERLPEERSENQKHTAFSYVILTLLLQACFNFMDHSCFSYREQGPLTIFRCSYECCKESHVSHFAVGQMSCICMS